MSKITQLTKELTNNVNSISNIINELIPLNIIGNSSIHNSKKGLELIDDVLTDLTVYLIDNK